MQDQAIYYTLEEAARYLRVSGTTLRRNIRDGHLRPFRVGRQYRFTREQLDAFAGNTEYVDGA